ncbi:hypothetical protein GOV08_00830 [Candidatus Woesearchaeota archaeon]|nr:hypothetical protein [Candidatus Woesearchaeota archaeon]
MNQKICKLVVENREKFIPNLFTFKQIDILNRYLLKTKLTNTEKTYLYSSIKRKIAALETLRHEFYINGINNMLKERVKEAKSILKKLNKEKAFISGSFLFSKEYNDVDIYIISKKRKQYHVEKNHFIFITKEDLKKPIFQSAAKYSVSNFFIDLEKPIIKRPGYNDLIMTYEIAINEIIDNDDQKALRDLIFEYNLQINRHVMDSYLLMKEFNRIKRLKSKEKIKFVNETARELLINLYSKKYLYNELGPFLKRIKNAIEEYQKNENLEIYHEMLNKVKDECRRAKT